jgi:hypothetical protein
MDRRSRQSNHLGPVLISLEQRAGEHEKVRQAKTPSVIKSPAEGKSSNLRFLLVAVWSRRSPDPPDPVTMVGNRH